MTSGRDYPSSLLECLDCRQTDASADACSACERLWRYFVVRPYLIA